jgi:hypothetical protein
MDKMPIENKTRLEAMPGWSWDTRDDQWEEGFCHLKEFAEREGHCLVAAKYINENGFRLGQWVSSLRGSNEKLSVVRKARLVTLPAWSWDVITDQWEEGFRYLEEFADREGHCLVADKYINENGFRLGKWVRRQRVAKDKLTEECKARLEALPGWSWDVWTDKWEEGIRYLIEYVEREGHARVPQDCKTVDGYRLGQWVRKQRLAKEIQAEERKARLVTLPGWSWDALTDKWEEGLRYLIEYVAREGHARVPKDFKTTDVYRLGLWVGGQRSTKDIMSSERKARLEAVAGWCWDTRVDRWEAGLLYLIEYVEREGHARVPQDFKTIDDYRLGQWVSVQRGTKDSMSHDRKGRLEVLPGWGWDALSDKWEDGLRHLKAYVEREGHCLVSTKYINENGFRLGQWVSSLREAKEKLSEERRTRLETLPGWSWDVIGDQWKEGFRHLEEFADREGHAKVPEPYKTVDGYRLGQWVRNQRVAKEKLSGVRKARLETLPGWVWRVK